LKIRNICFGIMLTVCLSGCASMTPTREVIEGYRIYDIKGTTDSKAIALNIKTTMQKNSERVIFTNNIPPSPLPEKPGRFTTTNPYMNTKLGALMASQGASLKVPKCENSIITATSNKNFQDTEGTTFFVCLLPYVGGYHMDIYYTFTKVSGGFGTKALGRSLAQSVVGDSSQFIPRTIEALVSSVKEAGGNVSLIETYP